MRDRTGCWSRGHGPALDGQQAGDFTRGQKATYLLRLFVDVTDCPKAKGGIRMMT